MSIRSDLVVEAAVALKAQLGSSLTAIHVLTDAALTEARRDLPQAMVYVDVLIDRLKQDLREQTRRVSKGEDDLPVIRVTEGIPGSEILNTLAKEQFDYVVIGVRNRSRVGKFLLGSVTQEVMLGAPCPVLAVPVGSG